MCCERENSGGGYGGIGGGEMAIKTNHPVCALWGWLGKGYDLDTTVTADIYTMLRDVGEGK